MINSIKPEDYIFKFGKYMNMRAVAIAELYKVNPKTGKDEPVGLQYMIFLCEKCDWFKHKDIIEQIIKLAEDNMSDLEEEEQRKRKKKKRRRRKMIKKKRNQRKAKI